MPVPRLSTLRTVAAQELAALLRGLLAHEREVVTDFVLYLAEFDRRGFALALGYGSLFDYCTRGLGLSRSAAYRRVTAARLLRRFPVIESMLRDGRLCLMTLTLLKDVLAGSNHRELLAHAAGLSKEQVAALVAVLRPKAAPRDSIRPLPAARLVALPATALHSSAVGPVSLPAPASAYATTARDRPKDSTATASPPAAAASPTAQLLVAVQPIPPPRVQPISGELRVLRVTVSREFLAELEEVKEALSHTVPSGRFEEVVRACFRLVLARHHRRSGSDAVPVATPSPSVATGPPAGDAKPLRPAVPTELERQVRQRNGNRCAVVGPDGRVCGSRYQLELHHVRAVARGGQTTLDNLLLVCRRHNDWLARQEFGEGHMARCRRRHEDLASAAGRASRARSSTGGTAAHARANGPVPEEDAGQRNRRGPPRGTGPPG